MVVLNHDGVDISEEPGRTIESYGLTPQSKLRWYDDYDDSLTMQVLPKGL